MSIEIDNPNQALMILRENNIKEVANGVLKVSDEEWKVLSLDVKKAINYLCYEWDFTVID